MNILVKRDGSAVVRMNKTEKGTLDKAAMIANQLDHFGVSAKAKACKDSIDALLAETLVTQAGESDKQMTFM